MDLPDFGPLLGGLALYMLPTLIAYGRGNRQALAIGALNLLLGWTVLGWVGALIWALIVERRSEGELHRDHRKPG
ncbi:superinfection immunity protein [Caulobacter sp. SLTY]|nr:superinfection immunity protein [Caulobacter sp. SLTY]